MSKEDQNPQPSFWDWDDNSEEESDTNSENQAENEEDQILNSKQKEVSQTIDQAFSGQTENKEKDLYSFIPGTPIFREHKRGMVYAGKEFVAKKIKNKKIAGYGAYELMANTVVYSQRGWSKKTYFTLKPKDRVGLASKGDYRPKKIK
jgi:hypothetical protein